MSQDLHRGLGRRASEISTATLVGRRRELSVLAAHLDRAVSGRGRLVVIAGEPGLGKSRLLDELAEQARACGMATVFASCREGDGVPPLWPWTQVVRSLGAGTDPELEVLLDQGELGGGLLGAVDPAGARFRLYDRVCACLHGAATRRPMLLVVDDLQWADRSSLLLLQQLTAQLRSMPLVVATAYRDTERTAVLEQVLRELPSDVERLALAGLSHREVAEFAELGLRASVAPEAVATIRDHTGGNPLFVRELVRLLADQGEFDGTAGLPAGLGDVLGRRLAMLSSACRSAMAAAAVIGREFDTALVARVLDVDATDMAAVVDEAQRARLVHEVGHERFEFVHDLFRQAAYEASSRPHRLRLHLAVGEAIEHRHGAELEAHLDALTHHFTMAAAVGDATRAVAYARRAAARASGLLAFEEAAAHLRRALDVHAADPADRADLLVSLGQALWRSPDLPAARAALTEAIDLARSCGDGEVFAAAALAFGGGLGGNQPLAPADAHLIAHLEEALERLPASDSPLRCRVLSRLAVELYLTDELARRTALSGEALEMARRLDDLACLATALYSRQIAVLGPDSFDERLTAAEEIIALADRVDDTELALWGHLFLAWAHAERCLPTDADLAICEQLAERLALPGYRAEVALRRAVTAQVAGRFDEVRRLEEVVRAGEASDLAANSTRAALLSLEWALKGPHEELAELVATLIATQPEKGMWRAALGIVHVELGRLDEARREFEQLAARDFELPRDQLWLFGMYYLGLIAFALDDRRAAEVLVDRMRPHAEQAPVAAFGSMATPLGLLEATRGRFDDALAWLDLAEDRNVALGNRAGALLTRRERAAVLLRRGRAGDRARAADMLTDVMDELRRIGFAGYLARAERLSAEASRAIDVEEPYELRRVGRSWLVRFEGRDIHVEGSKGMDDLAELLARPGEGVAAVDLTGAPTVGDAGDVLDVRARREIRTRVHALDEELTEAQAHGDVARADVAREQRDELAAELASAVGLGGRARRLDDGRERARKAVTWRLRRAIRVIGDADTELGQHLDRAVRTGVVCTYAPDPPKRWRVDRRG